MAYVVIDKSYLDAASQAEVKSLYAEHAVLMSDVLFYELMTTSEESRRRCFNKFPNKTNPGALIPNVGTLLRYELNSHRPCTPLYDRHVKIVFKFNKGLREGTFKFTKEQHETRQNQEAQVRSNARTFFELAMLVPGFFPHLKRMPFRDFPDAIDEAKQQIATNVDKVREIYSTFLKYDAPPNTVNVASIDTSWAYFRWIQVRVLYSLNLLLKYQGRLPQNPSKKFWRTIEHDMLDADYVILGSLAGALASNDNSVIENFLYVRPGGVLFTIER